MTVTFRDPPSGPLVPLTSSTDDVDNDASPDWRVAARMYLDKWSAIERSDALFGQQAVAP